MGGRLAHNQAGALIITGHAHAYARSYEIKRFATKVYSHHRTDIQVGRWQYDKVHLNDGGDESGRTMVAVVGTGGYKNERQQKTGGHWAKVYSTGCQQVGD